MVFIVLLGLWALVLAPTALRWVRERSNRTSWESLGEQAVASSADYRSHLAVVDGEVAPGRYFGDAPIGEHLATSPSTEARRAVRQRRRSALLYMVAALVGSSVLSFIPAFGFLRMVAILDLIGLLAFVGFAFYTTNAEAIGELLGRGEEREGYAYGEDESYEDEAYGYHGYDEAEGYEEQWYEPRRAIGQ